MACITSTALSLCWNWDKLAALTLERGLRQENPLSPYLFVLCMEVLGSYITKCIESKRWHLVWLCRDGSEILYIFFADDLLLFGEAFFSQARVMEYVLEQFCGISRQRVSRSKSRIRFLMNIPSYLRNSIYSKFRIQVTLDLETCFGMPLMHGRVKRSHFMHLMKKTERKLGYWKVKFLPKATQTVLIPSTLVNLPMYSMHAKIISKTILY